MNNLLTFTGIIIIVFGLLQIILFFKIWKMTNHVKGLWNKTKDSTLHEACFSYVKGDVTETEKLLHEAFLHEVSYLSTIVQDRDFWRIEYKKVEEKYTRAFEKINKPAPDFEKFRKGDAYLL